MKDYYQGPIWKWFGLSYSNYLVIPRSLMQGMPFEWQQQMVALLEEAQETYQGVEDDYDVRLRGKDGRFKKDPYANYRHPEPLPYRKGGQSPAGGAYAEYIR